VTQEAVGLADVLDAVGLPLWRQLLAVLVQVIEGLVGFPEVQLLLKILLVLD